MGPRTKYGTGRSFKASKQSSPGPDHGDADDGGAANRQYVADAALSRADEESARQIKSVCARTTRIELCAAGRDVESGKTDSDCSRYGAGRRIGRQVRCTERDLRCLQRQVGVAVEAAERRRQPAGALIERIPHVAPSIRQRRAAKKHCKLRKCRR